MTRKDPRRAIQAALRTRPERARRLVRAYAQSARRRGDALQAAEARLFLAELDLLAGKLRSAARHYGEARSAFSRLAAPRALLAAELGALQVHALLGEKAPMRRRMRSLRALAADPLQAALVENAIGSALDALGEDRAAEDCFRHALRHLGRRRTPPARIARATARCNLGIRLARRGAVGDAVRELDQAHELFEGLALPDWATMVRHNRGWARGLAGQSAEALEDLRGARTTFLDQGDRRGAGLARLDEAELILRLGNAHAAIPAAREAAQVLDRSASVLEAARARLVAARGHALLGNAGTGRRMAEKARDTFAQAGDRAGQASASVLLGDDLAAAEAVLRRTGHWLGALDALLARARSLAPGAGAGLLRRRMREYPPVLRRWVMPDLLHLQARGRRAERIPLLRRAFRAAETLRRLGPTGSLRASVLAAHLEIYEELAAALLERGRPRDLREAFLVLDAVRARTLREETEREAPGLTEAPRLRALRARLEALWRSLERRDDEGGDLRRVEVKLLEEVSRCEREFIGALSVAERSGTDRAPCTHLPADPCLAFSVVRGALVGMLSRDGAVHAWDGGPVADARADLDAFRFQVNRRLHGARDPAPALAALERLGEKLLGGVAPDQLTGRLLVVLPPELGSLPVEALGVDGRPLLETTAVSYLPYACARGADWRRGGGTLLVGIESTKLPEVSRELAFVRRQLGRVQELLGERATRKGILTGLRGKRLIHLAGHARAREDLPLLSALRVGDGWITATDLAGLALDRSLVVLSACRTGDPSLRWQGEALGGFPRALLAAGAAALVASRWEVPDATAHAWMRAFYRELKKAPDRAVARAARTIRDKLPHPADWAAFLFVKRGSNGGEPL
jgi:tetratricopeptide (TPR) repeat protein